MLYNFFNCRNGIKERKGMIKPKMDLGKALATMGFGTARLDDAHGKRDAQEDLNTALTRLMEAHEKKKKKVYDTEKIEQRREMMLNKCRDEVRTIHEAYQFLSRKYQLDKERLKEKEKEMERVRETMKAEGDIEDENDKEEQKQMGSLQSAMALKSAANAFKGQIDNTAAEKDSNNKNTKKVSKAKLDTVEENNNDALSVDNAANDLAEPPVSTLII